MPNVATDVLRRETFSGHVFVYLESNGEWRGRFVEKSGREVIVGKTEEELKTSAAIVAAWMSQNGREPT